MVPEFDIVTRVAGEGGEGVISCGEMFALALAKAGLEIFTFRTYPAEIKGGPAMLQVRASEGRVLSQGDDVDVLVALNEEGRELHFSSLKNGGLLIQDLPEGPINTSDGANLYPVPLADIAANRAGSLRAKNMVALGVLAGLWGLAVESARGLVERQFGRRGGDLLQKNLRGLEAGYAYAQEHPYPLPRVREAAVPAKRLILSGNQAACLGAVAAGCRYYAGYPITPASDILEWMARYLHRFGGAVVQTEDEMSALASVLGASFAGKKALTATSGPGFSLMAELVGLSTMAEVPCVVIDAQRAGPSTGMPSKAEQGDLNLAIYGGHGDSPRIVLAPTDVESCFFTMVDAFNLSERYQMPVIVLSDQTLAHRTQTIEPPDLSSLKIVERRKPTPEELRNYERYRVTEDGVSPMSVPGGPGRYVATGLEHLSDGAPAYDPDTHQMMSEKRHRKLEAARKEPPFVRVFGNPDAPVGIIGWGSSEGPAREALRILAERGVEAAAFYTTMLWPVPEEPIASFLRPRKIVVAPELNYGGQYAAILRRSFDSNFINLNKTTGLPFTAREIADFVEAAASEH